MSTRTFALVAGIVYAIVGVMGFVPGLLQLPPPDAPELVAPAGYGWLLGLFPVNVVHNVVHLAIGIWGLAAYASRGAAVTFARGLAILYAAFAVMGLLPVARTAFGLVPLFGHDIWLHAATAAIAAWFGWGVRRAAREGEVRTRRAA
jgi:hypothetical protein